MALITIEDYKTFLAKRYQKDEFNNERDLYYTNILIPAGEKAIKEYTENDFQSVARPNEEHFIIESQTRFIIPRFRPVLTTPAIVITLDGETIDADDFALMKADNTLWHKSGFWVPAIEPYLVTYTGGETFAREDKFVVCKFIAQLDEEDRANFATNAEAEESALQTLEGDDPFKDFLNKYRRVHL